MGLPLQRGVVSKIALLDEKLFLSVCSAPLLPGDAVVPRQNNPAHWRAALVRGHPCVTAACRAQLRARTCTHKCGAAAPQRWCTVH